MFVLAYLIQQISCVSIRFLTSFFYSNVLENVDFVHLTPKQMFQIILMRVNCYDLYTVWVDCVKQHIFHMKFVQELFDFLIIKWNLPRFFQYTFNWCGCMSPKPISRFWLNRIGDILNSFFSLCRIGN